MRYRTRNGAVSGPQNTTIEESVEFEYHRQLYGFYELKGISCSMTLYPESYVARADMFAGPFPNMPPDAQFPVVPTYNNLAGAALHTQC